MVASLPPPSVHRRRSRIIQSAFSPGIFFLSWKWHLGHNWCAIREECSHDPSCHFSSRETSLYLTVNKRDEYNLLCCSQITFFFFSSSGHSWAATARVGITDKQGGLPRTQQTRDENNLSFAWHRDMFRLPRGNPQLHGSRFPSKSTSRDKLWSWLLGAWTKYRGCSYLWTKKLRIRSNIWYDYISGWFYQIGSLRKKASIPCMHLTFKINNATYQLSYWEKELVQCMLFDRQTNKVAYNFDRRKTTRQSSQFSIKITSLIEKLHKYYHESSYLLGCGPAHLLSFR